MADIVNDLCDLRRKLSEIAIGLAAGGDRAEVASDLRDVGDQFDGLIVGTSLTLEALEPLFETGSCRGGVLSVMDLAYNAFMIGRNMENREGGGRCDWFNDTAPLMIAGVDRLRKETIERMDDAREDRRRFNSRVIEGQSSGLNEEQAEAGAACLYGHLDSSFIGGSKVNWPQVSDHTKRKYLTAFAAATRESNRVTEPA